MIPRNTSTSLAYEVIGIDIPELGARKNRKLRRKVESQKGKKTARYNKKTETPNYKRNSQRMVRF
jgi:hypothetical protein